MYCHVGIDMVSLSLSLSLSLSPSPLPPYSLSSSLGEYSESFGSSDEEDISPREKMLHVPNSNGFKDFCVKSLKSAAMGRKEIKIAEQGN